MKKLKTKLLSLIVGSALCATAQTNYKGWYTNNTLLDFSSSTPVKKTFSSNSLPNSAINSMYDSEGKLLFYISNNTIYNKFNNSIGTITGPSGYNPPSTLTEIAIIPYPNNNGCQNKYYLMYGVINSGLVSRFAYGTVDMNANNLQGTYTVFGSIIGGVTGSSDPHLAVGKINTAGKRFIYSTGASTGGNYIQLFEASNTGISYISSAGYSSGLVSWLVSNREMELSNAGDKLAVSSTLGSNTQVDVLPINTRTGLYSGTVNSFNVSSSVVSGLEFDNSGNNLYYSVPSTGVYVRDLTLNTSNLISGTSSYGGSFLEKDYNGSQIICASGSTIKGIDIATNTLNSWAISYALPSNATILMPDQIDGENYDATSTINIDALAYNENTNATWIPTSNPILTSLQNITVGNLTTLPRVRWGGDLTISSSAVVDIRGMEFQHYTNTEIKVNGGSNLSITGSFLHAHTCGLMWKGIDVNNNNSGSATNLTLQKITGKGQPTTRLADAIKGVYAHHSNSLVRVITNTSMYDNEKSVVITNGNASNEFSNSYFTQVNPLRDQTYGSNNGYGSNKYGITGIELQYTGAQTIGLTTGGPNTFDGGQYGVDCITSSANSYYNTLQNIKGTGIRSNANYNTQNIYVQNNYFYANFYDIDCFNGNNLTVIKSSLNNCLGNSINWNYNWGRKLVVGGDNTAGSGSGSSADANTFSGCNWTTVYCLDNDNENTNIQINYNTMQNAPWAAGVYLNQTSLTSANKTFNKFSIANNTINQLALPITLQNIKGNIDPTQAVSYYNGLNPTDPFYFDNGANIESNTINYSTNYNVNGSGIRNYNSPQTKIFTNNVTSDNSYDWQNIGVDVSDSPMSFLWTNVVSAGIGIEQRLNMTNANVMCNDLNTCVIGIQLGYEWLRNANDLHGIYGIYNRRNNFTGGLQAGYDMECYYCGVSQNQWCNPFTNQITYTGVSGNIIAENFSPNPVCYPCRDCRTIAGTTIQPNEPELTGTANGKLNALNAVAKYNIYKTWSDKFITKTANKNTALLGTNVVDDQRLADLVTVNEALSAKNYSAATTALQTISGGNVFESNLATVYGIIATKKTENYRKATLAEKTTLIAIAEQHPIEAGPAVYNARAILHADFNMEFSWNDSSGVATLPVPVPGSKLASPKAINSEISELSIYPNPTADKVIFTATHNNSLSFSVINVLGVQVASGVFSTKTELSLSHLPKGVYIVNFTNTTTGEVTKKSLLLGN